MRKRLGETLTSKIKIRKEQSQSKEYSQMKNLPLSCKISISHLLMNEFHDFTE